MLIEYKIKSIEFFKKNKMKETNALFSAFISSSEGNVLMLYHQYLKIKDMLDSLRIQKHNKENL